MALYCLKRIWVYRKDFWKNDIAIIYIYGILIGFACAAVSGHVLIAPAVSLYMDVIIVKLVKCLDK